MAGLKLPSLVCFRSNPAQTSKCDHIFFSPVDFFICILTLSQFNVLFLMLCNFLMSPWPKIAVSVSEKFKSTFALFSCAEEKQPIFRR